MELLGLEHMPQLSRSGGGGARNIDRESLKYGKAAQKSCLLLAFSDL